MENLIAKAKQLYYDLELAYDEKKLKELSLEEITRLINELEEELRIQELSDNEMEL